MYDVKCFSLTYYRQLSTIISSKFLIHDIFIIIFVGTSKPHTTVNYLISLNYYPNTTLEIRLEVSLQKTS